MGLPDDRRGVERPPGLAVEPGEVDARQLVDDGAGRERLEVEVGAVRERGGREAQRERMAASDPVDAGGVGRRDAGAAQQLLGVVAAEVAERQRLEQLAQLGRPRRDRLVTTGEQEPRGVGDARQQHLADPVVEQREGLVVVDGEHRPRRLRAERGRDLRERAGLAAEPRGERVEEASLRRLDRAPIQGHDGGAALTRVRGERREQRRLADAGEAVDEHDDRHVLTDELQQRGPLAVTPDELGRLPVEQRAECRSHASQVYAGASVADSATSPGEVSAVGPASVSRIDERKLANAGFWRAAASSSPSA